VDASAATRLAASGRRAAGAAEAVAKTAVD